MTLAGAQIALREGDAWLAVVKDGKILAKTSDMLLSHKEFVARALGTLPKDAEVVTIGKFCGKVVAITSKTFHGVQVPASAVAQTAAQGVFR